MPQYDTTANRAYQKPHPTNPQNVDADRLRSALDAIDTDVQGLVIPYMGVYFSTPAATTITVQSQYEKAAGTTTVTNQSALMDDNGVSNRIRYTGTTVKHFHIVAQVSVDLTSGNNQDIGVQVWRYDSSGAAGALLAHSEAHTTIAGTEVVQITTHADTMLDQNDYIELHVANNSGTPDITVEFGYLFAMGMGA